MAAISLASLSKATKARLARIALKIRYITRSKPRIKILLRG